MSATEQTINLDGATVRYRVTGDGPTLVFVHGVWVAGPLWNDVVGRLGGMRCVVPTWPLGAHADPAPAADLSARATAKRIPDFLEALDQRDVTLVGNDTGGGLCLAALGTGRPEGLRQDGGADAPIISGGIGAAALLRIEPWPASVPQGVCVTSPRGARARAIFGAFPDRAAARKDALRVTQSLEPAVTLDALRVFSKPVLLAWGAADRLFPLDHARRLEADFADARVEVMNGASTFVMLDQPDELAAKIAAFVSDTTSNA
jgi:pimeloyl-ACP methyl ester carboxylesterase